MSIDLYAFQQKIEAYPEANLLPEEEKALTITLETFKGLFGAFVVKCSIN